MVSIRKYPNAKDMQIATYCRQTNYYKWHPSADKQPANGIHPQLIYSLLIHNNAMTKQEDTVESYLLRSSKIEHEATPLQFNYSTTWPGTTPVGSESSKPKQRRK
jgi:hypothetical protein